MPAHLGYILNEIPKWFSKSGVRHDAYKELFETFEGCTVEDSTRDVTRMLIGGGGGGEYSYIHVLPDKLLFKSNSN